MRVRPALFWTLNVLFLLANVTIASMSWSTQASAGEQAQQSAPRADQIQGTIRFDPLPPPIRGYELLALDPANQAQLQAELVGRLAGLADGRVEDSWLDPNRAAAGGFRMFYLISWQR
jgi:hypothetical protein